MEIVSGIIITTSIVTFIASAVLLYFNEKIGTPIGEWVAFLFMSFIIGLSELLVFLFPDSYPRQVTILIMAVSIFIISILNYWTILSEYDLLKRK